MVSPEVQEAVDLTRAQAREAAEQLFAEMSGPVGPLHDQSPDLFLDHFALALELAFVRGIREGLRQAGEAFKPAPIDVEAPADVEAP